MEKERNINYYVTWERILEAVRSLMGFGLFLTACFGLGVTGLLDCNRITVPHAAVRTILTLLVVILLLAARAGLSCLQARFARERVFLSTGMDVRFIW